MSRDLGRDVPDLKKLYASKLRADFSHPTIVQDPEDEGCSTNHDMNSNPTPPPPL